MNKLIASAKRKPRPFVAATKGGAMEGMQLLKREAFQAGSNMATNPNGAQYMTVWPGIWQQWYN